MKYNTFAGIDDATKCPVIGSIFVSGVVAKPQTIGRWKRLGVKDSKLITSKKRRRLAENIKGEALAFATAPITPSMIDDKIFNLNEWELIVSMQIVQNLLKDYPFEHIRLDNWEVSDFEFRRKFKILTTSKRFQKKLFKKSIELDFNRISQVRLMPEHKSDENYIVVGAASILSKTASEDEYEIIKSNYGDFGSGSPGDPRTRKFVHKYKDILPPEVIRTSWKTFKHICKLDDIYDDFIVGKLRKIS